MAKIRNETTYPLKLCWIRCRQARYCELLENEISGQEGKKIKKREGEVSKNKKPQKGKRNDAFKQKGNRSNVLCQFYLGTRAQQLDNSFQRDPKGRNKKQKKTQVHIVLKLTPVP